MSDRAIKELWDVIFRLEIEAHQRADQMKVNLNLVEQTIEAQASEIEDLKNEVTFLKQSRLGTARSKESIQ